MIPTTVAQIADLVGGTVAGQADRVVTGPAFVDSRRSEPGGIYVAVVGERVDGHDYADAAVRAGAAAVLGGRPTTGPTVVVPDPVVALGALARHVVGQLAGTDVVALTGSQGKTGTKDYLAQVLAAAGSTVATAGNLNNELGVPLTVLRADHDTRFLVVEMGARGRGHVAYLCELARPRVAAVLNVGTAHLGEFGSRAAIAAAKGEIVEALPPDGVAVLNADDELTWAMRSRTRARVLSFGRSGEVSWRSVELDDLGRPTFELGYAGGWWPVRLAQAGAHQVVNAAAAGALALAVGREPEAVTAALTASTAASRWRMEVHERVDGTVVVNDCYNANPASMAAGLEALVAIGRRRGRPTVAVLGEMKELGEESRQSHRDVGRAAADLGVDLLVTVGDPGADIAEGARTARGWTGTAVTTADRDEALSWLRRRLPAGAVVLVKASRGVALETVAEGLLRSAAAGADGPAR